MKVRTTINFDEALLQEARVSGVSNISGYLEALVRSDLRGLQKLGKREEGRLLLLHKKLEGVRRKWLVYVSRRDASLVE